MSIRLLGYLVLIIAICSLVTVIGCGSSPATTATTTSPTMTSEMTFGKLANDGKDQYVANCAGCHGTTGQGVPQKGPPVWGATSHLGEHGTAQNLLNIIAFTMPPGKLGVLTNQTNISILCYILVQNNSVNPNTGFVESQLSSLILK